METKIKLLILIDLHQITKHISACSLTGKTEICIYNSQRSHWLSFINAVLTTINHTIDLTECKDKYSGTFRTCLHLGGLWCRKVHSDSVQQNKNTKRLSKAEESLWVFSRYKGFCLVTLRCKTLQNTKTQHFIKHENEKKTQQSQDR